MEPVIARQEARCIGADVRERGVVMPWPRCVTAGDERTERFARRSARPPLARPIGPICHPHPLPPAGGPPGSRPAPIPIGRKLPFSVYHNALQSTAARRQKYTRVMHTQVYVSATPSPHPHHPQHPQALGVLEKNNQLGKTPIFWRFKKPTKFFKLGNGDGVEGVRVWKNHLVVAS